MGDANLDAKKWNCSDYNPSLKSLADLVQEHLLEESSYQVVSRLEINPVKRRQFFCPVTFENLKFT